MVVSLGRELGQRRGRIITMIISIILTLSMLVWFPLPRSSPWLVWMLLIEVISVGKMHSWHYVDCNFTNISLMCMIVIFDVLDVSLMCNCECNSVQMFVQ